MGARGGNRGVVSLRGLFWDSRPFVVTFPPGIVEGVEDVAGEPSDPVELVDVR